MFNRLDGKRALLIVISALTAGLLLSTALAERTRSPEPSEVQQRRQPLDPLTPEEIELATRIANADPRVKEALGPGRRQLIVVQFLALKSSAYRDAREPEQMNIGRHAAVVFYRYDIDQGVHVIVDLEQQKVAGEITRMDGKGVPLGSDEVTEAFNLALRDGRVKALLGPQVNEFRVAGLSSGDRPENRVEGLRVVATSPSDPCYRHRCLDLLFRRREGYLRGTSVTVDLSVQTVRVERIVR